MSGVDHTLAFVGDRDGDVGGRRMRLRGAAPLGRFGPAPWNISSTAAAIGITFMNASSGWLHLYIEVLSLPALPKSMVIIGSGAVGVEFASIYRSFGAEVTVIEMLPRLVPVEDEEVSKELLRSFKKKGINCFVNTKVEKVEKTKNGVSVSFTPNGEATQNARSRKSSRCRWSRPEH